MTLLWALAGGHGVGWGITSQRGERPSSQPWHLFVCNLCLHLLGQVWGALQVMRREQLELSPMPRCRPASWAVPQSTWAI